MLSNASKLASACSPVLANVTAAVTAAASRNVAECQETSRSQSPIAKTNPTPVPARSLAPRMLTAAELLLAGSSVAAAAVRLGISPRTIFRWLKQPRFRAEIDRRADLAERFKRAQRAAAVAKRQEMS
jgi:DNA-binding NarL/FixJ family response regulator